MDENVTNVLHGFFNLNGKEKLKLVESINEYFDSTNREEIREKHNENFKQIEISKKTCICCEK